MAQMDIRFAKLRPARGSSDEYQKVSVAGDFLPTMGIGWEGTQETPEQACALIAAGQHGLISRRQAWALGIGAHGVRDRLVRGRWTLLVPGVYGVSGSPRTWYQQVMAACLWAGEGGVASHSSAAALWAFEGFAPRIEISTTRALKAPTPGLTIHRVRELDPPDMEMVQGIPVTSPSRTLLDLCGPRIGTDRALLEAALDDAIRRGLTSLPRLHWTLGRLGRRGRPGTSMLRDLLRERAPGDPPPASALEARLIKLLTRAKLPRPHREYLIKERGRLLARVDVAYPERFVAVEADGYRFHSGRVAWQRDRQRRNVLTARGWRVLHVTWEDLMNRPDEVVAEIRRALGELGP